MASSRTQVSAFLWRSDSLVWWKCLPVFLSPHGLTSGQEESGRLGKEWGLFHPYVALFLTLKTRCVSITELINKSWMELETTLVSENFNELQTALASLLADCDDALSQSRLGPSSFLLSCCFLFFVCRLLHCRVNERRPCSMQNRSCCTVLSQQRTSDYMGIYSIFNRMIDTQNAWGPVLCQTAAQVVSTLSPNKSKSAHRLKRNNMHRYLSGDVEGFFFFFLLWFVIHHLPFLCTVHCLCQKIV